MKKTLFFLAFFLIFLNNLVFAESKKIPCVRGYCDGWTVWYEKSSAFDTRTTIHIYNNSGITAFKLFIGVGCYDNFGKQIARFEIRYTGPLYSGFKISPIRNIPSQTWKMDCDINYSDTD